LTDSRVYPLHSDGKRHVDRLIVEVKNDNISGSLRRNTGAKKRDTELPWAGREDHHSGGITSRNFCVTEKQAPATGFESRERLRIETIAAG